ncbi:MAG: DUF2442 domain-containing protein [Phycisphaerales bacterium]
MHRIASVQVAGPAAFALALTFADGRTGRVNLGHLAVGELFREWQTPQGFASVAIARGGRALVWPDGADLCADALYYEVTGLSFDADRVRTGHAA